MMSAGCPGSAQIIPQMTAGTTNGSSNAATMRTNGGIHQFFKPAPGRGRRLRGHHSRTDSHVLCLAYRHEQKSRNEELFPRLLPYL